jgi:diaminopimelate decarboxylase
MKAVENLALRGSFGMGENGHLTLHGTDLVELCDKHGTPLFVFDEVSLAANFTELRQAFENVYPKVMVCYSVKTNNNLAICQTLKEKGAYVEVSSELDLHVALKAGFPGERIIFDGPFKPREALKKAMEEEVLLINVESLAEMERLNSVADEMGVKQAIGIRINPFKDPGFSKYTSLTKLLNAAYCNLESRFGFSLEEAYTAFKRATELESLSVKGVMTHPYRAATKVLLPIVKELREKLGVEISYLNIGGGFNTGDARFVGSNDLALDFLRRKIGLKSKLTESGRVSNIEAVAKSIVGEIRQGLGGSSEPTIIVEPGRFITSSSGILLVRVDHVKNSGGHRWVVVDGGTNLVPRFGAIELRKVVVANKASSQSTEEVNITGPLLYAEDFIALKTFLPEVSEGDILSIFGCGAYTLSRSNQFLHPRPAAILLNSKGEDKVIRERESFEDFLYKDRAV